MTQPTEAELLGLMAMQSADAAAAQAGWKQLYERHVDYIYFVLRKTFGTVFKDDHELNSTVTDTFVNAYKWAGRIGDAVKVQERFPNKDPEIVRVVVLKWLVRIAKRALQDKLRGAAVRTEDLDSALAFEQPESDEPEPLDASDMKRLTRVLSEMSRLDAEILRASLPWYHMGTESFALPAGEAAEIALRLGMNAATFRQRRHRLLKRLKARLQEEGCLIGAKGSKS